MKEHEIDRLFEENKRSFDRLEVPDALWTKIKTEIQTNKTAKTPSLWLGYRRFWAAAAAIALLALMGVGIWMQQNQHPLDNLVLASPEGSQIPLDPSKNKLTLVQFWESGNVLCTEDNCYYYLPAYEKYKDKGFEIYAISLDDNKQEWIAGIEENQLPWIHVSDLQGWESPVCIECNITKVPSSFLLNDKGNIIARDLDAEDLEDTLDRLLAQNL